MCDFVCGTIMLHAKSPLHWSVIHYQVTGDIRVTFWACFGNIYCSL